MSGIMCITYADHSNGFAIDKSACRQPNPSTVYCITTADIQKSIGKAFIIADNCNGASADPDRCREVATVTRNQFPDGPVTASSGTTQQVASDCWKLSVCKLDVGATPARCIAGDFGMWQSADKTTTGTAECPTNEGSGP
jgi:hypothetical protein